MLTLYKGTVIERILDTFQLVFGKDTLSIVVYPIAIPATIRPTIKVATLFAPACIAHPHMAKRAPI